MRHRYKVGNRLLQVDLLEREPLRVTLTEDELESNVNLEGHLNEGQGRIVLDDRYVTYFVTKDKGGVWVTLAGKTWYFERKKKSAGADEGHGGFGAPMPGKVIAVNIAEGDTVSKGDVLVIMEAMKMEHRIEAPADGKVTRLHCVADQVVDQDFQLLEFEANEQ